MFIEPYSRFVSTKSKNNNKTKIDRVLNSPPTIAMILSIKKPIPKKLTLISMLKLQPFETE